MRKLNPASPETASITLDHQASTNPIQEELSRRSFLFGLGALALSACGGGSVDTAAQAASGTRLLAGTEAGGMIHPGLLHTEADFQRMAAHINEEPWLSCWNRLITNPRAQLNYTARPVTIVYRGYDGVNPENYSRLFNDVAAAYACALRWKVSGDAAYANKAVEIMNAWSAMLTAIRGTSDAALAAGIYGYEFANAGEIMRGYSGWAAADFARFQTMMRTVFYPMNHDFLVRHNGTEITHYWANWDLCNMASILAIGVLCDEQALVDEAVAYFKSGPGNGSSSQSVYFMHPGYLGQWQESGRDQGHNTLGIALMGAFCEMAWNQGFDLYGHDNNRFLAGAEYVAKANLKAPDGAFHTVPYVPYTNVDKVNQNSLSTIGQGNVRPCWALVYHHYASRKGLAAPWTRKFMELIQPEGGGGHYGPNSGGFDQLGYGTLTCTRPGIAAAVPPSGLTGQVHGGAVVLSWWGSVHASSYTVKRSLLAGGPYATVAAGITDPLSYTDSGLADGTWYYVITATTPDGESAPSNEVAITTGIALHTHLSFDEGSGTSAADSSGNGHAGTLAGGANWAAGRRGNAVNLNGTSAYVSLPPDIMTDVGDFTICAWVYWNAARTWDRVFDFGAGGRYMMLTARHPNGLARFAMSVNGRDGERYVDANFALARRAWTHVAVTLSGRTCTLYMNGTAVNSNTNMFHAPFQLGRTHQNWIGRSQRNEPYFSGMVDDFRIYRGALSAEQLVALMNEQVMYTDLGPVVQLTQQGAVYNRLTQKYVGGVSITNKGPALNGPLTLRLTALSGGVTLDNASGVEGGVPYVTVNAGLAPGATLTVPLTFTNPSRGIIAFTPKLYKKAF
jgi:hypothetical protein